MIINVKSKSEIEKVLKESYSVVKSKQWYSIPKEVADVCSMDACKLYTLLYTLSRSVFQGSNEYLAKFMGVSESTIKRYLNELAKNNCITIIYVNNYIRYVYCNYSLPFILLNSDNKESKSWIKNDPFDEPNGGFDQL